MTLAPGVTSAGMIERVDDLGHGHNLQVSLDAPCPGTMLIGAYACGGTTVSISAYLYGPRAAAAAAATKPHIERWLGTRFPAPAE